MKMKRKSLTAVLLVLVLVFSVPIGGCGKQEQKPEPESSASESAAPASSEESVPEEPSAEESESETPEEPVEISCEKAMDNFLEKVAAGGYVIDAEGFLKTTAYSDDLVLFDYADDDLYNDFAVMSVNGEVFQGFLEEDGIAEISYLGEGSALDMASPRLLSFWLEASGGNIYNLFYNDVENPLQFVSYEDTVKKSVASFVGYGNQAIQKMHEVYLILDAEDPSSAQIQAVVDDDAVARIYFDDVDVKVTFGDAGSDARAEKWMQSPEYPEARTGWDDSDIFVFNSVFLPGYGETAIPFPPFASYALKINEEDFLDKDQVEMRDPHASEDDVKNYAALLEENGFTAVTEDGAVYYRKLLREETKCYASISLAYNDGMDLIARKYYEYPTYDDLGKINALITDCGYPELPETDVLTEFHATDRASASTESWLFFYNYKAMLYVDAHFGDYDGLMEYLDAYVESLAAEGYTPVYVIDEEDGEIDYYRSPDESQSFRYHFSDEDDETVTLLFKAEQFMPAEEAEAVLTEGGFPEIDLSGAVSLRDLTKFYKIQYDLDYKAALSIAMPFESSEEAEAFLGAYVADLEEKDFMRMPPSEMNSNKNNAYIAEEAGLGVAFDYFPAGEENAQASIYFDFRIES